MERNGRLSNSNTELPIWICTDTQAVKLKRGNKNIDIIIPNDGTLSFVQGILSPYPLCFENNLCNNINQNDLRTYNNASPCILPKKNILTLLFIPITGTLTSNQQMLLKR